MLNKTRKRSFSKSFQKITKIPYESHLKVLNTRDRDIAYQEYSTIRRRTGAIFTASIAVI